MTQVSIDAFNGKRIAFIMCITNMFARINNINVTEITVRTVIFRFRSIIYNFLNTLR